MALHKRKYTEEYSGIDPEYYLNIDAPVISIITNRNLGKTTNIVGYLCAKNIPFLLITRYKYEVLAATSKTEDAVIYWDADVSFDNKSKTFKNSTGDTVGYVGSLSGVQDIKNSSSLYHDVKYIVFDEFLPVDGRYIRESIAPGYEVEALRWVVGSVLKGGNKDVKVILLSNAVSADNPYFKNLEDSKGVSLLTHLSRAVLDDKLNNFTVNDPDIYMTLHIDESYNKSDTRAGSFANGRTEVGIFEDISKRVVPKTQSIQKLIDRTNPILFTGGQALYRIRIKVGLFEGLCYYWAPNKTGVSPSPHIGRIDFEALPHYYSDIYTRCAVFDFYRKYKIVSRTGI